jgi:hypothetical protein
MAQSKSQQKREAAQKAGENKTPGWKENQQKQTSAKDSDQRDSEKETAQLVKIRLLTDYRDVAKKGDVADFDEEKAAELVRLGRAEYVSKKKAEKEEEPEKEEEESGEESDE